MPTRGAMPRSRTREVLDRLRERRALAATRVQGGFASGGRTGDRATLASAAASRWSSEPSRPHSSSSAPGRRTMPIFVTTTIAVAAV